MILAETNYNINFKDINIDNLRLWMSTVIQDFNIYSLTIRENVAISNLNKVNNDELIKIQPRYGNILK